MLLFPSLLLLFLSACAASPAASPASYNFYNDTITATVNLLTHSVRVKAFGSVENAAVLHKLHNEKSLATRLSWATPGVPKLFIVNSSAADGLRFFKFYDFGATAKLQLKSATVAKSLAAAAGRKLAVEIDESQIHLLDVAAVRCQIFCLNDQLCDPMEATVADVSHDQMLLFFVNPSIVVMKLRRSIQENPLQVLLKCSINYVQFSRTFVVPVVMNFAYTTHKLTSQIDSLVKGVNNLKEIVLKLMTSNSDEAAVNENLKLLLKDYLVTVDNRTFISIQYRSGFYDFYRNWRAYEDGFGDESYRNYWIGLKTISALTATKPRTLRLELTRLSGDKDFAEFAGFQVFGADTKYLMNFSHVIENDTNLQNYNFDPYKLKPFSTYDSDNDDILDSNCAKECHSGWWYGSCNLPNPNSYCSAPSTVWQNAAMEYRSVRLMLEIS